MNLKQPKTYAVKAKNEETRLASRSGGIFTVLSDYVLNSEGVVYGCILDDNFHVIHARASTRAERNRMRGSKYVQSHMGDIYHHVRSDLENGKSVLFSGTSCQIAGLKMFLGSNQERLLCVDIVCHGVPSPKVWRDYIVWQEKKHGKISSVDFRNKQKYGWADHVETLSLQAGKQIHSRVFTTLFYGHHILRPSCYECPFKSILHPGDITIADYWGIDKAAPGFNDNKGVSLVIINNDKGAAVFDQVRERVEWRETKIEDSMQPPLKGPFRRPIGRDQFWKDYAEKSFRDVAFQYGGLSLKGRLKNLKKSLRKKKNVLLKKM